MMECGKRWKDIIDRNDSKFRVVTDDVTIDKNVVHKHAPWTKKSSSSGLVPDEGKRRQFSSSRGSSNMYGVLGGRGGGGEQSSRPSRKIGHILPTECFE